MIIKIKYRKKEEKKKTDIWACAMTQCAHLSKNISILVIYNLKGNFCNGQLQSRSKSWFFRKAIIINPSNPIFVWKCSTRREVLRNFLHENSIWYILLQNLPKYLDNFRKKTQYFAKCIHEKRNFVFKPHVHPKIVYI